PGEGGAAVFRKGPPDPAKQVFRQKPDQAQEISVEQDEGARQRHFLGDLEAAVAKGEQEGGQKDQKIPPGVLDFQFLIRIEGNQRNSEDEEDHPGGFRPGQAFPVDDDGKENDHQNVGVDEGGGETGRPLVEGLHEQQVSRGGPQADDEAGDEQRE